jgi:predicted SnoaL-like aldol condensation-catalyzing enzyme
MTSTATPPTGAATSRKEAASSFLGMASSGDVRRAFDLYIAKDFRHHNVHFHGDASSLARAMEQNAAEYPEKALHVERVIEEGDLVAVHSRVRHQPGAPEYALAHIFRFAGDRVVELWDIAQEVPKDSPNENGAF